MFEQFGSTGVVEPDHHPAANVGPDLDPGQGEATVSSQCTMSTLALARECADSKALADARQQAEAVATNRANRVALSGATDKATAAASESAYRAAKNAPLPLLKNRRAAALAEDRAAMNLLKKIQNRFPGYP